MSEIESLASRVESLSNAAEFWNKAMLFGLVVAAIAAAVIVITTRLSLERSKQASEAQRQLDNAKDRILQGLLKSKDVEIESLQRATGETKEHTANLELEVASARLKQAELATSWRKNDRLNPSPSIRGAAHFCEVVRIDAPKHF